ncbi:aspartic proteinase A1-like isoform X2 [Mercurialis annua]|uniref:aspartic proteinase A1-like isoform X2 n=1 Tax=Mercurialis annua TaxID=3986 RepID=UPI002160BF3F|nr:aspartic proteinase A1-like isoform X2 [Mercurialis annua]
MAWSHFQDSNYYNKTYDYEYSSSDHFSQTVVTQINHDIGASGIISQQCKTMIEQYGEVILEMLLSQATGKICSQIGFCTFDGTRGVRMWWMKAKRGHLTVCNHICYLKFIQA